MNTTPETPPAAEQLEEHRNKVARAGDALLPIVKAVRDVDAYAKELRRNELEAETPPARLSLAEAREKLRDHVAEDEAARIAHAAAETPIAGQDALRAWATSECMKLLEILIERDALALTLAQAQSELNNLRSIHSGDAPDEIDQLKQQLAQARGEVATFRDAWTTEAATRQRNEERLEQQLAQAQGVIDAMKIERAGLREDFTAAREECERLRRNLRNQVSVATQAISQLRAKNGELERMLGIFARIYAGQTDNRGEYPDALFDDARKALAKHQQANG